MVATGSILEERREEGREPWREMDFLFSVRLRSSRKLGCRARLVPLGEVGGIWELKELVCWGGGDKGAASCTVLLRLYTDVGGVFFRELCFHDEDTTGGVCGWGLTTATLGAPGWRSVGRGGGGRSSESGGGGGK